MGESGYRYTPLESEQFEDKASSVASRNDSEHWAGQIHRTFSQGACRAWVYGLGLIAILSVSFASGYYAHKVIGSTQDRTSVPEC